MEIRLKRVYEQADPADGYRVLVDRLWPRGVSKDSALLDEWNKEVAPSTDLRKRFGHDPGRFDQFRAGYTEELREVGPALSDLRRRARDGTLTLLYAAKNEKQNHAMVLADVLRNGLPGA